MTLRRAGDLRGTVLIAALLAAASGCSSKGNSGPGTAGASGASAAAGKGGATGASGAGGGTGAGGDGSGGTAGGGGGASGGSVAGSSGGTTAGRGGDGGLAGSAGGGRGGTMATATRDFDLLFMIDNSTSMQPAQTALVNAFPSLVTALQALPGGMPNLHIAVVTSDMGAGSIGGCINSSLNGAFQTLARPPCTSTMLTGTNRFISNVNGQTNYAGPIDDVFRCIAPLGTDGCGYEQPLLAIDRALGADGAAPPAQNQRFLRRDADLVLVMLTNEDDCSATAGAASPLFADGVGVDVGPVLSFRCNEYGHLCDEGAPQRRGNLDSTKTYTNCRSNEQSLYVKSVAAFARDIKALKPFPDQQISVTAIVGVPQAAPNGPIPYSVTFPRGSTGEPWPYVDPACGTRASGNSGDPSVRLVEFTRRFGGNGAVFSICDSNYAPVMDSIAQRIARRTTTTGAGGGSGAGGAGGAAGAGGAGGNCTTDLAGSTHHMCARKTDGTLWCWGYNNNGQLGDGTMGENRPLPVQVAGLGTGVAEAAAGYYHTCAVRTDGTLWCWGSNEFGQLGDGTMMSSPTPVKVNALGAGVAHVTAGWNHTCAIKTDGTLWCWGQWSSALGYDATAHQPLPKQVAAPADTGVAQVSGGYDHTCARKTDGSAYCWGANDAGQLGAGSGPARFMPVQVTGLASGVAAVSIGADRSCVRKTDDTVWCWGRLPGDGTNAGARNAPAQVSPTTIGFTVLATGGYSNCAARANGSLACWGDNGYGQLGAGVTSGTRLAPVEATVVDDVAQIAMGIDTTCVRRKDNSVWCWGGNRFGELGDGSTTTPSLVPVRPRLCP